MILILLYLLYFNFSNVKFLFFVVILKNSHIFVKEITIKTIYIMQTFKIIFTHNEAYYFIDNLPYLPQIGSILKKDGLVFVVKNHVLEYIGDDAITNVQLEFFNERKASSKKFAKCVNIWKLSGNNLTIGREYPIISMNEKSFRIETDRGEIRTYAIDNTQFIIIE